MHAHVIIRRAADSDAEHIARIYNHYVGSSTATFDFEPKSAADRRAWLADRQPEHPVFVAECDGRVVGWGALSSYGSRHGWRYTAEAAVYVDSESTGLGIGPTITAALVDAARAGGLHALVSQIVADNEPSLKMAERAGFARVGTLREVGRKFDRWLDVALMELVLASEASEEAT